MQHHKFAAYARENILPMIYSGSEVHRIKPLIFDGGGLAMWNRLRDFYIANSVGSVGVDFMSDKISTTMGSVALHWDLDGVQLTGALATPEPVTNVCLYIARLIVDALIRNERRTYRGGTVCMNFCAKSASLLISDGQPEAPSYSVTRCPISSKSQ